MGSLFSTILSSSTTKGGGVLTSLEAFSSDRYNQLCESIFVQQKYEWDCGVACALMVMRWSICTSPHVKFDKRTTVRTREHEEYKLAVERYIYETWDNQFKSKPLWTIDVALYLLRLHNYNNSRFEPQMTPQCAIPSYDFLKLKSSLVKIKIEMYTTFVGVHKNIEKLEWYQKEINLDKTRIPAQFKLASDFGMQVVEKKIDLLDLSRIFTATADTFGFIAIILIDETTLINGSKGNSYVGHYILLVGFDEPSQLFMYLNPAMSASDKLVYEIGLRELDAARTVSGTDCDIILCRRGDVKESIN